MIGHKFAWFLALGTFCLGVFSHGLLDLRQDLPSIEVDASYRARDPNVQLDGQIRVELVSKRLLAPNRREAVFKITNRTRHPINYSGYFEGDIAQAWIRQNGKITDAIDLQCWNGVDTQTLEPTHFTYFTVPIPPKGTFFDVGFDFRTGLRSGWETVWFRFPEFPSSRTKP